MSVSGKEGVIMGCKEGLVEGGRKGKLQCGSLAVAKEGRAPFHPCRNSPSGPSFASHCCGHPIMPRPTSSHFYSAGHSSE